MSSVTRMMSIPCTVISEVATGEKDRYGDPVTEMVEVETRCAFQQQTRRENEDGGDVSDTVWLLYLPYGTQIGSSAVIKVEDREYETVAEPWPAHEGSRAMWHIEATCRRRAGSGES
jgi:hypothetical protein